MCAHVYIFVRVLKCVRLCMAAYMFGDVYAMIKGNLVDSYS